MKRLVVVLSLLLLLSFAAFAGGAEKPTYLFGLPAAGTLKPAKADNPNDKAAEVKPGSETPAGTKTRYVIHFKDGGSYEADNYTMEKDSVRVMKEYGAIYFDRNMVKSIEEVRVQEHETAPAAEGEAAAPSAPATTTPPPSRTPPSRTPPSSPRDEARPPSEPVDNNGHTEAWWKKKVVDWTKKKEDAEQRYQKAQEDWNKYNGLLSTLPATPGGGLSQYDLIRFQDLRGASRIDMDKAEADLNEANSALNSALPEEARKANAPPGWLR
jgi:hypothetical protein